MKNAGGKYEVFFLIQKLLVIMPITGKHIIKVVDSFRGENEI